ncbi:MAG: hypothetical protein V3V01_08160 [Acidimicrobiales bacterium]
MTEEETTVTMSIEELKGMVGALIGGIVGGFAMQISPTVLREVVREVVDCDAWWDIFNPEALAQMKSTLDEFRDNNEGGEIQVSWKAEIVPTEPHLSVVGGEESASDVDGPGAA